MTATAVKSRFSWLRPPKTDPEGLMSLADHLRELRYRVVVSVIGLILMSTFAAFFYNQLYLVMMRPYLQAVDMLKESNPELTATTVITGVTAPFQLAILVCVMAGLVLSSPLWLYQLWAYIAPALLANEKKYALGFLGAAIPLFLLGVVIGYLILPQGISVLLAFTPNTIPVTNLLEVDAFLKLTLQMMVIFGLGFLMPVVVVGANMMGVLKAEQLKKARTYVIFGLFVFGAAATPSTDPFSMLALSLPMIALYLVAEVICRIHDKRKAKAEVEAA